MSRPIAPSDPFSSRSQIPRLASLSPSLSEMDDRRQRSSTPSETPPNFRKPQDMSVYEKERLRRRRMIENPTPLFVRKPQTGSVFTRHFVGPRVAETTIALAEKTNTAPAVNYDDVATPPLNVPKTWGSKATKRDKWLQKILYPENTEELRQLEPQSARSSRQSSASQSPASAQKLRGSVDSRRYRSPSLTAPPVKQQGFSPSQFAQVPGPSYRPDAGDLLEEQEEEPKPVRTERYQRYLDNVARQHQGLSPQPGNSNPFSGQRNQASADTPLPSVEVASDFEEHTPPSMARKSRENTYNQSPDQQPRSIGRTWGSRAKRTPGWMRNILAEDEPVDRFSPPSSDVEKRKLSGSLLPSVDIHSSAQEPTPPSSRPASAQPSFNYGNDLHDWGTDLDFTGTSIQTSPILRVRNTKLDEVRDAEMQSLTARAVAINRLEEIRERNSEERSFIEPLPEEEPEDDIPEVPREEENIPAIPGENENAGIIEERAQPASNPMSIFRNGQYEGRLRSESATRQKEDSFETLRKLARTLSKSPAPEEQNRGRTEERFSLEKVKEKEEDNQDPAPKSPGKDASPSRTTVEERPRSTSGIRTLRIRRKSNPEAAEASQEGETGSTGKAVEKSPLFLQPEAISQTKETGEEKVPEPAPIRRLRDESAAATARPRGVQYDPNKRISTVSVSKSDSDPEERIAAEAKLFDLPDTNSQRNSLHISSRSASPSDENHEAKAGSSSLPASKLAQPASETTGPSRKIQKDTPKPKPNPLSMPTPRVTGAFIDTPVPAVRQHILRGRSQSTPSPEVEIMYVVGESPSVQLDEASSANANPPVPVINTARLTTAAEDLREIQLKTLSEIPAANNLDDLLDMDEKAAADADKGKGKQIEEEALLVPQTERERQIERQCIERMNQALRNTSSTIRDATHGLERLEQQVSSLPDSESVSPNSKSSSSSESDPPLFKFQVDILIPKSFKKTWLWKLGVAWCLLVLFCVVGFVTLCVVQYHRELENPTIYMGPHDWWGGSTPPEDLVRLQEKRRWEINGSGGMGRVGGGGEVGGGVVGSIFEDELV